MNLYFALIVHSFVGATSQVQLSSILMKLGTETPNGRMQFISRKELDRDNILYIIRRYNRTTYHTTIITYNY